MRISPPIKKLMQQVRPQKPAKPAPRTAPKPAPRTAKPAPRPAMLNAATHRDLLSRLRSSGTQPMGGSIPKAQPTGGSIPKDSISHDRGNSTPFTPPRPAPSPSRPRGTGPMDGTPTGKFPLTSGSGAGPKPVLMKKGGKVKSFASKKTGGIATKGKTKRRFT